MTENTHKQSFKSPSNAILRNQNSIGSENPTPMLDKNGSTNSTGNYETPLGLGMKYLDSRFIYDLNRGLNPIPEDSVVAAS